MLKKNIAVFISGGGTNLQAIIDSMDRISGEIRLVVSNKKDAYGLERGKKAGIDSLYLDGSLEEYDSLLLEECKKREIDLVVLAGYLKILDPKFIGHYKNRIINIHPSLLPSFGGRGHYGERVHRKVYERGVRFTGATVHFVDEGTDTGPIILQDIVEIDYKDSIEDIGDKVLEIEHRLLPRAVELFCDDRLEVEEGRVKIL